jgi:hypothetical protein
LQNLSENVILGAATSAEDLCRKKAACPETQEGKKLQLFACPQKGGGSMDIHLILEIVTVISNVIMTVLAIVKAWKGRDDKSHKKM